MQKIILFCFTFFALALNAQNIKLEGVVTDNSKVGLEMANVMAVNQQTKVEISLCRW